MSSDINDDVMIRKLECWLAKALPFVPHNLVSYTTGELPKWVKDAVAYLESQGYTWTDKIVGQTKQE